MVVERLILGGSLEELDLDRVTGRLDLRGLWLARTRGLPGLPSDPLATVPTAEGVTWRDLDLSGSTFRIDLRNAALSNIAFDSAGWPDWNVEASTLRDCTFVAASMGDTHFDRNSGLQDRPLVTASSRLEGCDFTRTRLGPYSSFGRADIVGCTFASTRFPSPMSFRGASLQSCRFTGSFRSVSFGWTGPHAEPPPHLDADVSGADFESLDIYAHAGPGLAGLTER